MALVQALANFLGVVRRYDSPRFVWMMTGLLIRMAQYLGLQRDGSHFKHLTPYESEMRRRVWWAVVNLDMRASEDQGTDLTITHGSFDTKIPLSIDDADISPGTEEMPAARDGVTDMSLTLMAIGLCDLMRQMLNPAVKQGVGELESQNKLLSEMCRKYEHGYFQQRIEPDTKGYWVGVTISRLVMAKMTLIVSLPALFSAPSEDFTEEIRTRLLVAAIEVAEFNHTLNTEPAYRPLRWMYQTYTHWHAIVYLMMEISRRRWSATVERAWVALHSSWLIPTQVPRDRHLRIWFPLRKLMTKARAYRSAELLRLRGDPEAAARLDIEDRKIPLPSSSALLVPTGGDGVISFRERWSQLVAALPLPTPGGRSAQPLRVPPLAEELAEPPLHANTPAGQPMARPISGELAAPAGLPHLSTNGPRTDQNQTLAGSVVGLPEPTASTNASGSSSGLASEQIMAPGLQDNPFSATAGWSDGRPVGPGDFVPWLWVDPEIPTTGPSADLLATLDDNDPMDLNMNWDGGDVNWYDWIESAGGLDRQSNPP